ncbi:guanylate cyclase 32E-like isoform X2 [Mytilus edulis]|uniref:guanylate cyclase 32E-like isoform X2 n=1 Tax=Mytilus edulis TaxID=6550 RepID=UPI0039EE2AB4
MKTFSIIIGINILSVLCNTNLTNAEKKHMDLLKEYSKVTNVRDINDNFTTDDFTINTNLTTVEKDKLKISFLSSVSIGQGMGKFYAGAYYRAIEDIKRNSSILPNYTIETHFQDTANNYLKALNDMTHLYVKGTTGFIGPEGICSHAAIMAASWNLPMLGYRCHDSSTTEPDIYHDRERRTFVRIQPSTSKVSKSIISLIQHYKWKIITMIVGSSPVWNKTADSLSILARERGIAITQIESFKEPYSVMVHGKQTNENNSKMRRLLDKTFQHTRIYVFLGDYHALIDFVRAMHAKPETNTGEYVVISADQKPYFPGSDNKYFLRQPYETELKERHIKAFHPLMLLAPRAATSPEWGKFLDDVRKRNTKSPINLPVFPAILNTEQQVPIFAAYLYDAVRIYIDAIEEVLRLNGSISNGSAVVGVMRDRTYRSIQGYDFYIDSYGDSEGNYSLLRLTETDGKLSLRPVGVYQMNATGHKIPSFIEERKVEWLLGYTPKDQPDCGFDGEKCLHQIDWRIATICSVVVAAMLVAGGFVLRHYLYEQKLAKLLWKIEYKDLMLVDSVEEVLPHTRPLKRRSLSSLKYLIGPEEPERTTLLGVTKPTKKNSVSYEKKVLIGSYKGTVVSIKQIFKKNVDINRTLKKQLQLRKELNNDNVNRFIGACVETPHLFVITQYCARGSLFDILQNADLNLDDMFIASLVADLIKGMIFIHESELQYHGNLKSANCLVDSRWVLQVSDFGLQQLIGNTTQHKSDSFSNCEGLLWTAPELLRNKYNSSYGTPKGDIYSFAIIMYEIHGRLGPWGRTDFAPKEIIHRVKMGEDPPYRPNTNLLMCEEYISTCIHDCWNEDPEQRPDFKFIKYRLKPMHQGLKANIFDNMLAIMEKYANNLEEVVAQRTQQLSEEKKMTENLLFRMLPRSVANQLRNGEMVEPEHYECASVYFSDIVGFTSLSAESTPMQVIDMLNDLYTCFDSIIGHYDVYKVETIGDAYMVVSGLPIRNGNNHAGEIASMSLHLLSAIKSFRIKHRPDDTLKLRIGIHSGPCVAGVVGLKMPRYTLFGDTINTASRMETTGIPLKIHCSKECKDILDILDGYHLSDRGYVNMKGKGEKFTYFLESEDAMIRRKRITMMSVYSYHDRRSNLEIDHATFPNYFDNYLVNGTNHKHCNGFVKHIDPTNAHDLKHFIDTKEQNGNLVNSVPCSPCDNLCKPPTFTLRPPPTTPVLETMPLMNVKWQLNNAGYVGPDVEDVL